MQLGCNKSGDVGVKAYPAPADRYETKKQDQRRSVEPSITSEFHLGRVPRGVLDDERRCPERGTYTKRGNG